MMSFACPLMSSSFLSIAQLKKTYIDRVELNDNYEKNKATMGGEAVF
jgi:hypothetical protein